MRGLATNIKCTSRLILATRLTTKIPCFKPVLCLSLFRKALPRRPVASVDAHTMMVTAQCGEQPPAALELSYDHMIEVAKAYERIWQEYQMHKQAHSGNQVNYQNPLLQTSALSKSFQKGPPKKTCGKCGCSHNNGDCPAWGTTSSSCGKKNHWSAMCRSSGRRHSLSGHTPSPRRPHQQRQKTIVQQAVQERQGSRRRPSWLLLCVRNIMLYCEFKSQKARVVSAPTGPILIFILPYARHLHCLLCVICVLCILDQ